MICQTSPTGDHRRLLTPKECITLNARPHPKAGFHVLNLEREEKGFPWLLPIRSSDAPNLFFRCLYASSRKAGHVLFHRSRAFSCIASCLICSLFSLYHSFIRYVEHRTPQKGQAVHCALVPLIGSHSTQNGQQGVQASLLMLTLAISSISSLR